MGELIVGCYTPGDYARVASEKLLPSLANLGLVHDVQEVGSLGSWIKNGFLCQRFLWAMDCKWPNVDLLFLDVDAVVHRDPWYFLRELNCDLAAHLFDGRELLTGTLYLPAGPLRRVLLEAWIAENEKHPDRWDQRNLQALLNQNPERFRFAPLPAEFCCIFDLQRKRTPHILPVIEHFQASRQLRRSVK